MRWIGKRVARLKKKKRASLKRKKGRSHKMILNVSIMANRGIMPGTATQNRNRMKELEQKPKS
jgi:hypothetical protein